jgi:hypothetical protein
MNNDFDFISEINAYNATVLKSIFPQIFIDEELSSEVE